MFVDAHACSQFSNFKPQITDERLVAYRHVVVIVVDVVGIVVVLTFIRIMVSHIIAEASRTFAKKGYS